VIGFVGSVFSPYYFKARKNGPADPENHCAINVALYGKHRRWAMTERVKGHISRGETHFCVGPSEMLWDGDTLEINIHERCAPFPIPLAGQIRLSTELLHHSPVVLSDKGQHFWQAVAPCSRVEVRFEMPKVSWSGSAYHDMNWGDEPLEQGFRSWTWLRASAKDGTQVIYDAELRNGARAVFGRKFKNGIAIPCKVPNLQNMDRGFWRMKRQVRSEKMPLLIATLEDAPFYTRNHVRLSLAGETCEAIHESLSLDRFVHPVTQLMLPFKARKERP
jgi:carotenoid 1,2-hydratase